MVSQTRFAFAVGILTVNGHVDAAAGLRKRAGRIRNRNGLLTASNFWSNPSSAINLLESEKTAIDQQIEEEEDLIEMMQVMGDYNAFSMPTETPTTAALTEKPTVLASGDPKPSIAPSEESIPTSQVKPTGIPATSVPSHSPSSIPSDLPSLVPSNIPTRKRSPSPTMEGSHEPTGAPTDEPTETPTEPPTDEPTKSPTETPTETPTKPPTSLPTNSPSESPTKEPSETPTPLPSTAPSVNPSAVPTEPPSVSQVPSSSPSAAPTITPIPTGAPTLDDCKISAKERSEQIFAALDAVADSTLIRDETTSQGMATNWLVNQDFRRICPDDEKLIQRWVMAVIYFSTGGNDWFQCSAAGSDACGTEDPFNTKRRFLSEFNECQWAGISCNANSCVTEIEFESNNLVGTIPTEIALLSDLAIWGMERGGLSGTIPSEIGQLSDLIFLDLDFNELSGSLPPHLFLLTSLTQLDLNNNQLTGSIGAIGVFAELEFLQLHANQFTGTIPSAMGDLTSMGTFTLHETAFTGVMPQEVCDLLSTNGGALNSLIADCDPALFGGAPELVCDCCTDCRGA